MEKTTLDTFSLEIFEGPLNFLLHLIQKSEIDIRDVSIHELTNQYMQKIKEMLTLSVDTGAEFVGTAALLLWMKSKMLLPKHEQALLTEEDLDPNFEIIYKVLEYCRFKDVGKELTQKEYEQGVFHTRGVHSLPEPEKTSGVEHLSIEDLATYFDEAIKNAACRKRIIHEEPWRVSDKIRLIRESIRIHKSLDLGQLFSRDRPKVELIVTFLAILELMKIGEINLVKEISSEKIVIFPGEA